MVRKIISWILISLGFYILLIIFGLEGFNAGEDGSIQDRAVVYFVPFSLMGLGIFLLKNRPKQP